MLEDEKQRLRRLKSSTARRLAKAVQGFDWRGLDDTDPRFKAYITSIASNVDGHNLYEHLGALRFLELCKKYTWNAKAAKRFIKFYECLKFSGTTRRQSYRMTPLQVFQLAGIMGLRREDGRRLCNTCYIFEPRKAAKTTAVCSLAVYDMIFGDNNAQAFVAANSYEQAKIAFDEIRKVMRALDPSEKYYRINREKIFFTSGQRDSFIECLTSNASTKDGLNASLVILDEYAQSKDTALKNVLTTSMGARREPLTVIITTASELIEAPFASEIAGVKSMMERGTLPDNVFASIFQPDVDDREDDPATWAKVQPMMGVTVQPDFYEREWATAQLSAGNMLAFRTKLLNVFTVNAQKMWFTFEKAKELVGAFDIDNLPGRPLCAVAFDLSVRDDFSAVSYTVYEPKSRHFYTHTDYYFPDGALHGHANEAIYRKWAADGALKLCQGDRIDIKQIANDIMTRAKSLRIIRIGYDAYKAKDLVNLLSVSGCAGVLLPYSQTYGNFNLPVESFELLAYDTPPRITINDNPINIFCLTNCIIDQDRLENKKPIKVAPDRKIDGVISMLMTVGELATYKH
jgi:phage terminase large subunit-like protein